MEQGPVPHKNTTPKATPARKDNLGDEEGKQQFAVGDRKSFVRAYETSVGNIIDAIQMGIYDFVPEEHPKDFKPTRALPGTTEKIDVLTDRVHEGLPLWHPKDRGSYNDEDRD